MPAWHSRREPLKSRVLLTYAKRVWLSIEKGEDIVKLMNENPALFAAILGQPDVSGVIFILPGKDPVEVKKGKQIWK